MHFRNLFILCTLSSGVLAHRLFKAAMIFTLMCKTGDRASHLHFLQTALIADSSQQICDVLVCAARHVPMYLQAQCGGGGTHLLQLTACLLGGDLYCVTVSGPLKLLTRDLDLH